MDGQPHFRTARGGGELGFETAEVDSVAQTLVAENPDVGAMLFECVGLPPYAHAVQEATGLPVYDITTLIGRATAG